MRKSLVLLATIVGSLLPGTALAASYTFNMNSSIVGTSNGLDHHYAYAWDISGFNLGSSTITGATLTFTNFSNWDNNSNQLFVYVAATASGGTLVTGNYNGSTAGFTQTTRSVQDSSDGTTISDYFSGTGATSLYNVAVGSLTTKNANGGHTFVASPSGFTTTAVPTLSINFANTAGVLSDLTTYIGSSNGGDFALLLDSDCHYFFSSAVLTITTSSVPEPGSIILLLTVLAGVVFGLKKKATSRLGAAVA